MSYWTGWKCNQCGDITPSIKMFCTPEGEHFETWTKNLGAWLYKHSHCTNEYDPETFFQRVTESMPEWIGSPMNWDDKK